MDDALGGLIGLAIILAIIGGWVQHLVTTWANDMLFLFVTGLFLPPVGVIHGWLIWLGIASS